MLDARGAWARLSMSLYTFGISLSHTRVFNFHPSPIPHPPNLRRRNASFWGKDLLDTDYVTKADLGLLGFWWESLNGVAKVGGA